MQKFATNDIAVIGIDIGGTKVSAALFGPNGDILQKEIQPVAERKGTQVIDLISALALSLIDSAVDLDYRVKAIGACVPGIYNPANKTAWAPNIPDWNHIQLWEELRQRIDHPSINIVIESDRSCYILGEVWKGCAKGCSDAIFMAVGTGIGAGILSNGRIVSGRSGIAGSIGWLALEPPYHRKYQPMGNFEHYASGHGITRSTIEVLSRDRETVSELDAVPRNKITSHHIFQAFENQDPVAIEVMDKAVLYWGMVVANLVSIFNPQKVILGGGVFGPAAQLKDKIFEEAKKWAQPLSIQETSLEVSTLKGDAGLIGAGYLAIKSLNNQAHAE
ncbi:MAG: glucokinase [Cyclobacteriaceae bacterium]|nr:MAG: glucokinase [Cyclobacteriaceae bacterium]